MRNSWGHTVCTANRRGEWWVNSLRYTDASWGAVEKMLMTRHKTSGIPEIRPEVITWSCIKGGSDWKFRKASSLRQPPGSQGAEDVFSERQPPGCLRQPPRCCKSCSFLSIWQLLLLPQKLLLPKLSPYIYIYILEKKKKKKECVCVILCVCFILPA